MKKLIFLLFPFLMLAQNPTNFPYGIKNTVAPSNSTPSYFVTQEVDGVHKKTPAANVEKTANKSDSYTTSSSTTYASTKAVFDGLATKQNTLTNPITGTGVSGRVSFWSGTNTQAGDNELFWDNTNKRLGIGTNTPFGKFVINDGVDRNLFITTDASTSGTDGISIKSLNDATSLYKPLVFQGSKIVLGIQGNVGIGTNNPLYDLSIERTTEPIISIHRTGSLNNYQWKTDGYKSTIGNGTIDNITLSDGGGIKVGTAGNVSAMTIQPLAPINTIYASNLGNVGIGTIPEVSLAVNGTTQVVGGSTVSNISPFHTIYALGDSQTFAGFYESNLQNLIGNNFRVKNRGLNGNSTGEMLARLNTDVIQMVDAEYIIVWGGINDVLRDYPATTIKNNLQIIYNIAHKAGLKVIAINLTPFGNYSLWNSTRQAVADDVNNWISTTSTLVDYRIDAHTLLKDPSNPLILLPIYDLDHLHVNEAGHIVLAEQINSVVGTWTPNPNTNTLNVTGNAIIEQQNDEPAILSLNPNSNTLGRWKKWELTAGNSSTSYDFNIGVTGDNKYITIQGADAGANAGNVGIGTTPYAKFVVHDGVNRNLALLSDAGQAGFSGMALASFNDSFSANAPLSILGSSIQIAGGNLSIITTPTTSAGTYDFLTRNTSTGVIEKINTDIALTGTPTAPTATVGTNTTQIATTAFVMANGSSSSATFTPTAVSGITFSRCYWIKNGNVLDVVYNFSITGNTSYSATMTLPNSFTINANSNGREIGGGKITTNSGYSRVQETATSSDIFLSIVSENTGAASGFARASVLIN